VVRRLPLAAALWGVLAATAALANPASQDPAKVPAGQYVLDKRHASLLVKVPHMGGFSKFTMRFDRLDGNFTYDPATWTTTKVTITVDPTSINTGLPDFDKTIAGPSYFNAAKHPVISFVSTKAEGVDGKGTVSGDLTFHGVTRPVVLDVTFNGVGPGMLGAGTRVGFSGTTRLKRSDFGVTTMSQFAGDDLDLVFEVEFVKK
jgi:polyisoprenoid-binding protein YceI